MGGGGALRLQDTTVKGREADKVILQAFHILSNSSNDLKVI